MLIRTISKLLAATEQALRVRRMRRHAMRLHLSKAAPRALIHHGAADIARRVTRRAKRTLLAG